MDGVPQLLRLGIGLKLVGRRAAGFLEPAAVRIALKRDQAAAVDVLDDELAETKRAKRRRRETEGARR